MNVLIACEESQVVCAAFRERGFTAFSCDIQEPSGGHPEWHIFGDVIPVLEGGLFTTMDGQKHDVGKWDLIIAHPPCTYLTVAANKYYNVEKYGDKARVRYAEREKAAEFFMMFANANCEHIAIENPVGVMSTRFRKPDCIIQPYQFGHSERKATCLWLKNLPVLEPTQIIEFTPIVFDSGKTDSKYHYDSFRLPPAERAKMRSRTFYGIGRAMAEQWGQFLCD